MREFKLLRILKLSGLELMPYELNNIVFILECLGVNVGYDISLFNNPSALGVESPEVMFDLWRLYKKKMIASLSPIRLVNKRSIADMPFNGEKTVKMLLENRGHLPALALYLYAEKIYGEDAVDALLKGYNFTYESVQKICSIIRMLSSTSSLHGYSSRCS